jgi:hypothetical protein
MHGSTPRTRQPPAALSLAQWNESTAEWRLGMEHPMIAQEIKQCTCHAPKHPARRGFAAPTPGLSVTQRVA